MFYNSKILSDQDSKLWVFHPVDISSTLTKIILYMWTINML